jgi:hypothetical protein
MMGRWSPSPEQIELVIDCVTARLPLGKAAELLGVGPRTVWIFARRIGMPFPAPAGRSRAPKTPCESILGERYLKEEARP